MGSQLRDSAMNWALLSLLGLITIFGYVASQHETIYIRLVPLDYQDPRKDGQFICGLVKIVDQNRFLSEQNTAFIFQYIDNTEDPAPDYKTKVFDVAKLTDSGELRHVGEDPGYEDGMFTLIMAPRQAECNQDTFENAKDAGGKGYYPVYVGDKQGIQTALEKYMTQANIHKKSYNNNNPKLCGAFTRMDSKSAAARTLALETIFNFPFNKDVSRSVNIDEDQECRDAVETRNAIIKSELFDTNFGPSFKQSEQEVFEFERVFKATVMRGSSSKAGIAILTPVLDGSATADDVDPNESLVVFKASERETDIFVTIREDGISEDDEVFKVEICKFANARSKRDVKQILTDNVKQILTDNVKQIIQGKIIDNFGRRGFFQRGRDKLEERLCVQRFSSSRLTSLESNSIIEFVLKQEDIKLEITSYLGITRTYSKFLTSRPVHFLEEYDATKHGQVQQINRLKAYYYPFYSGLPGKDQITGEVALNVGWVDIPKKPKNDQPRYAVTGTMNGCATVVMTKTKDDANLRVYHLQSPGPRGGKKWNGYIEIIRKHHPEVGTVLTSFAWEDYGVPDEQITQLRFDKRNPGNTLHMTVVMLFYDIASKNWYYMSQMNLIGLLFTDDNGKQVPLPESERDHNGKTHQVLVSLLKDGGRPQTKQCN